MNAYRALNVAGCVTALALGVWYGLGVGPGDVTFAQLVGAGSALSLLWANLFPLPRMTPRQHVALLGVGFLLLALGSPTTWLLGICSGLGSVLLWKAYQAPSSKGMM